MVLGIPSLAAGAGLCRVRHLCAVDADVGLAGGAVVADAATLLGAPLLLVHLRSKWGESWYGYDGNDGWDPIMGRFILYSML